MKREVKFILCLCAVSCMAVTCKKQVTFTQPPPADTTVIITPVDSSLVNFTHLNHLYTPLTFTTGVAAAGVYIYSEAPDYHLVGDQDEGYTCVDDVARATQAYVRSATFSSDTSMQNKAYNLITFILQMQSPNGYFYNFLFPGNNINTGGQTSINNANWWSWRALYTLTETSPIIRLKNSPLADKMDAAVNTIIVTIKNNLAPIPATTKVVSGITVPQWLPAGSGTDQAAILLLGLIPAAKNDTAISAYIKKLADGIALMQLGDATHFPYSCILSWENTWHAYGADQAFALMKAGAFLNDTSYTNKGLAMVADFFPWLLQNNLKSSFVVEDNGAGIQKTSEQTFEQIAYGIRPMVTAAAEAYRLTSDEKYADIAGHAAAWLLGANYPNRIMYSTATGICFDGINSISAVNTNSGAESTIEALLTMEIADASPAIRMALNKYKK